VFSSGGVTRLGLVAHTRFAHWSSTWPDGDGHSNIDSIETATLNAERSRPSLESQSILDFVRSPG